MVDCWSLGDGLWMDSGDLDVQLAPNSGLEIIPGQGLSLTDAERVPEWQSYTPVLYSATTAWTVGNGDRFGRYMQIGKLVIYYFKCNFGSTTSVGTSTLSVSLPVTADTTTLNQVIPSGRCQAINSGIANSVGACYIISSTRVGLYWDIYGSTVNASPTTQMTGTAPFTAGSADYYSGFIQYVAA